MATKKADLSYEQARDELTKVVTALESGGLSLEESLSLWERGEVLATVCQEWLDAARARVRPDVALQGNLDPAVVLAGWPQVRTEAADVLRRNGTATGHVFNLGHGVLPESDPDVLHRLAADLLDTVAACQHGVEQALRLFAQLAGALPDLGLTGGGRRRGAWTYLEAGASLTMTSVSPGRIRPRFLRARRHGASAGL